MKREVLSAAGRPFAIVSTRWHSEFTSRLVAGARKALLDSGVSEADIHEYQVPGTFELPLACQQAASTKQFDAVIALGVVIRGDTPHFEYVAGEAASGIMRAGLDTGVPVLFGVITADTREQAEARCRPGEDNKGCEAALSAIEMAATIEQIKNKKGGSAKTSVV
ncbi:MAG: 6,7-dimethyl-8-ribityllumazine synthase [Chloracidobacterium sp.]|nr:6,7-dimethyl-8-ribityllumazine synthase [Chloracidobacterium sp.]MCC6824556.1 6,7-dimethyl-8-ribityllumazine synthase [Acidobacteriota bacterium]